MEPEVSFRFNLLHNNNKVAKFNSLIFNNVSPLSIDFTIKEGVVDIQFFIKHGFSYRKSTEEKVNSDLEFSIEFDSIDSNYIDSDLELFNSDIKGFYTINKVKLLYSHLGVMPGRRVGLYSFKGNISLIDFKSK